jgi:hypothetical protein
MALSLQKDIDRQSKEEEKAKKAQAVATKKAVKVSNKKPIKAKKNVKKTHVIVLKPKRAILRSLLTREGV